MIFHHISPEGQLVSHVILDRGDGFVQGELVSEAPFLERADQTDGDYEMTFRVGDELEVIKAKVLSTAALSMQGWSELGIGLPLGPPATHQLFEGQSQFTWNNEIGYGLTERTIRF